MVLLKEYAFVNMSSILPSRKLKWVRVEDPDLSLLPRGHIYSLLRSFLPGLITVTPI